MASLAGLAVGPLAYRFVAAHPRFMSVLDVIVVVTVTGLVGIEILPAVARDGASIVIVFAAVGLAGPAALEQLLHRTDLHRVENWTHMAVLILGTFGLLVHAALEGAALGGPHGDVLPVAIVVHRIPVGLAIWWLLVPGFGRSVAASALAAVGAATVLGFAAGPSLAATLPASLSVGFQALVAGSLLHVVFFRQHLTPHTHD